MYLHISSRHGEGVEETQITYFQFSEMFLSIKIKTLEAAHTTFSTSDRYQQKNETVSPINRERRKQQPESRIQSQALQGTEEESESRREWEGEIQSHETRHIWNNITNNWKNYESCRHIKTITFNLDSNMTYPIEFIKCMNAQFHMNYVIFTDCVWWWWEWR